jgi:2-hydroxychromene-2-carboxylate isomerase
MADDQGKTTGASRSEMRPLQRRLSSRIIRIIISPRRRQAAVRARELMRRVTGAPHRVHYFHQVDDPYSHLAAQALTTLCESYLIELVPHLAAADTGPNCPEPELLATLARRDCRAVAPHYGLEFPASGSPPAPAVVRTVERVLAAALPEGAEAFASRAVALGRALWSGDDASVRALGNELPSAAEAETDRALAAGSALRAKRGHYSGGVFHYAGEWYWGVDRLHHLETRLAGLGVRRGEAALRFPRPVIPMDSVPRASEVTLEVFPSLRSPYTAIGFERAVELAQRTGVQLVVRPVLPMVMRGVPVTFAKGKYIMLDTHREAEKMGMPFGRVLDPIGEPVRRGYSLWPWARDCGRGEAFLAAFLRAAFSEGVDTSTDSGLRRVVERAGLPWEEAAKRLGDPAWEKELENNRLAMIEEMGQWGVPSFRLRGPAGTPDLCSWGQDRLWLVAREIQSRGAAREREETGDGRD